MEQMIVRCHEIRKRMCWLPTMIAVLILNAHPFLVRYTRLAVLTRRQRDDRVHSGRTVSLKPTFDHKKSVTITSQDGVHKNCSHVARRSDGTTEIGTSCERGIHSSRKEERRARAQGESDEVRYERQSERMRRPESKEQDRVEDVCIQHSVVGTRDETTADKEDQRVTSRARTTTTGNPGLKTTPREDV